MYLNLLLLHVLHMKKTITILFIVLFFQHLQLIAQDYQLFMSNRTYTYEYIFSGQSHFNVFMADTVIVNGTDSIFSNYPRSNDDNLYGPPADTTEYYSDTTWSGYKVIVSPNGKTFCLTDSQIH